MKALFNCFINITMSEETRDRTFVNILPLSKKCPKRKFYIIKNYETQQINVPFLIYNYIAFFFSIENIIFCSILCIYALESGRQVDTVYTDFSRAFDTVNHKLLAMNLKAFGLSGHLLQCLISYY